MSLQKTIKKPVMLEGRGLFTGEPCRMRFLPASPDSGICFICSGPDNEEIGHVYADISNVTKRARRTSLTDGPASVETTEHVLSAVWGLGIDNLLIEISGCETPSLDGSAKPFVDALMDAGLEEQPSEKKVFIVREPISVSNGDATLAVLPGTSEYLDIVYDLDYGDGQAIGRQVKAFRLGSEDYAREIAPSRTFLLKTEAEMFRAQGMGKHLSERDLVVVDENGKPIGNELRFEDEPVRHKICDLIGDLALLGYHLRGRVVGYKSGHELNQELVRKLIETIENQDVESGVSEPIMDIRKIMRLLPHRYPFLMVDRLIEISGDRKAVGIKNVTINEPFFQGHYPGQPIMPGVMILEALAQLSGILLSRRLEHTGKVAMLLSMDRVKMRRPVRPGDQLILEAEAVHVRSRTGHCRCEAKVDGEVAAEAEIKFMLVDAEPV